MRDRAEPLIPESPLPTGEQVGRDIARLADTTFERLRPQFTRYLADPRRRTGENGDTVRCNYSLM